jgi:hypothetical protein
LHCKRQLADFVEEDDSAGGRPEETGMVGGRTRKSAAAMTK